MPRKSIYSRDDVALAALAVVDAGGLGALTARRVALAIGSSTAPVYSSFRSMEELAEEVHRLIVELILDYCRRSWTRDAFLSMGLGFVHFADDHPQLFRALYLEQPGVGYDAEHDVLAELVRDLDGHPFIGGLPQDHKDELLFQAGIYALGIATTVVTERWQEPDFASIESWLNSIGGLLIRAAMNSAGRPVPQEVEHRFGKFTVPWRKPSCRDRPSDPKGDGT